MSENDSSSAPDSFREIEPGTKLSQAVCQFVRDHIECASEIINRLSSQRHAGG